MYFNKKEKLIIVIVLVMVFSLTLYKILNPEKLIDYSQESEELLEEEVENQEDLKEEEPLSETLIVHISGAIKNPGVIELDPGKRVIDAVEDSGGLRDDACLDTINLARKLRDGEKIYIPKEGEAPRNLSQDSETLEDSPVLDINTCTKEELMTLPGIGEKTAEKILKYRETSVFTCVEDIKNVSGIGDKKFEDIKDNIIVN